MRYAVLLVALVAVVVLAALALSSSTRTAQSGRSAQGTVDSARQQLQQNEAAGSAQVQRGLNAAGAP